MATGFPTDGLDFEGKFQRVQEPMAMDVSKVNGQLTDTDLKRVSGFGLNTWFRVSKLM
ncbi:MAG: hypothetical protein JST87_06205 [Bacteroidetes bacterium]|nr:hypothetical protein [Bacteroidota bacterium]MBS1934975.1 hypothetical protein [Bacteroidota bacterium]